VTTPAVGGFCGILGFQTAANPALSVQLLHGRPRRIAEATDHVPGGAFGPARGWGARMEARRRLLAPLPPVPVGLAEAANSGARCLPHKP